MTNKTKTYTLGYYRSPETKLIPDWISTAIKLYHCPTCGADKGVFCTEGHSHKIHIKRLKIHAKATGMRLILEENFANIVKK